MRPGASSGRGTICHRGLGPNAGPWRPDPFLRRCAPESPGPYSGDGTTSITNSTFEGLDKYTSCVQTALTIARGLGITLSQLFFGIEQEVSAPLSPKKAKDD